ncbi:MAG: hypothetical protein L7H08_00760 [Vulcanisaeta sp.]|nr:hypothetical protein [Vulcanisaeta sp.]
MVSIPDECHWEHECIVNSVASILINMVRGYVPKELIVNSAFRNSATCGDTSCSLSVNDYSVIKDLDYGSIKDGVIKVLRLIGLSEVPSLIQAVMDLDLESGVRAIDEGVEINVKGELGARINEALGIALYSIAAYEGAITRFSAAAAIYEGLGNGSRARFMEAMSKIARAEDLRVKAMRLHDEGKHDDERRVIEEASKLYASSVINFREAVGVDEARANEVLSMMDSSEVLANYYFTHGDISRAMQYYNACRGVLSGGNLGEGYWDVVKMKGDLCEAFYLLCKAIEEGDWRTYEEAGDKFLDLISEGLIDELTTEGAVMAYKGALDGINEIEDAVRIYSKYVKAVNQYFDNVVRERYGSFESLINEFRGGDHEKIAHALNTDVNTLKLYITGKVLIDIVRDENLGEDAALEILAYLAGLGLNPVDMDVDEMIEELRNFITDEDFMNEIRDLLLKVKARLESMLGN